jgi:hypothetical protein
MNSDNDKEISNLKTQVEELEKRNLRVDADKAWETSAARIALLTLVTYCAAFGLMWVSGAGHPWSSA